MSNDATFMVDAIIRSTGFMSDSEKQAEVGKTIYARNRTSVGKVRKVSYRRCAVCGDHSCYIVDWEDGGMTKPCTCGVKTNPDGTLEIE